MYTLKRVTHGHSSDLSITVMLLYSTEISVLYSQVWSWEVPGRLALGKSRVYKQRFSHTLKSVIKQALLLGDLIELGH